MRDRFSRQSFLGDSCDEVLQGLTVAIVGLGGGGSHVAQQLGHVGVGRFVLFDPQRVEESNLNRLVGGTVADVTRGEWKTTIARRLIRRVHPSARVEAFRADWRDGAMRLRDCDIVVGCVDTYRDRSELETQARRYLIPYLDIGMDVHAREDGTHLVGGQVILSMPGEACMRCLGFLRDSLLEQEAQRYGSAGPRPQVVWPNGVLASLAVGALMQLFTPWARRAEQITYVEYDGNEQSVRTSNRVAHAPRHCPHFSGLDLGDPWFSLK